eukprot:3233198-Rhodomonas_salina.1
MCRTETQYGAMQRAILSQGVVLCVWCYAMCVTEKWLGGCHGLRGTEMWCCGLRGTDIWCYGLRGTEIRCYGLRGTEIFAAMGYVALLRYATTGCVVLIRGNLAWSNYYQEKAATEAHQFALANGDEGGSRDQHNFALANGDKDQHKVARAPARSLSLVS